MSVLWSIVHWHWWVLYDWYINPQMINNQTWSHSCVNGFSMCASMANLGSPASKSKCMLGSHVYIYIYIHTYIYIYIQLYTFWIQYIYIYIQRKVGPCNGTEHVYIYIYTYTLYILAYSLYGKRLKYHLISLPKQSISAATVAQPEADLGMPGSVRSPLFTLPMWSSEQRVWE